MNKQKILWEKLAKENANYYINSDYGKSIKEDQFRRSGLNDYRKYVIDWYHNKQQIIGEFYKYGVLLEIGCGNGRMTEFMAKNFEKVIGIDISGEMIKQGKERMKHLKNIELLETDGLTIPLPDQSVNRVFSYLVFQHMKTKEMVESNFREVYRVLMSFGLFKVLLRTDKVDINKWWGGVSVSKNELKELAGKTGFNILDTERVKDYAQWAWLMKNG